MFVSFIASLGLRFTIYNRGTAVSTLGMCHSKGVDAQPAGPRPGREPASNLSVSRGARSLRSIVSETEARETGTTSGQELSEPGAAGPASSDPRCLQVGSQAEAAAGHGWTWSVSGKWAL